MLVWIGPGVDWLNSFVGASVTLSIGARTTFDSQMFYAMDRMQSYYADSVILHETGHWVMGTSGRSSSETGGHTYQCETWPGLAWKEGFADYFAQVVLGHPLYTAVNASAMYGYDISGATGRSWPHASPTAPDVQRSSAPGLLQRLSELDVAQILWRLSGGASNVGPLLDALGSRRATVVDSATGRFERGYTRRSLGTFDASSCGFSYVRDTGVPIPVLPDFLDALNCMGFSRSRIDFAVRPDTRYPYPVTAPRCR